MQGWGKFRPILFDLNQIIGEKSNLVKFNPFWTDLIQSDPKKIAIFILMVDVTTFYSIIL